MLSLRSIIVVSCLTGSFFSTFTSAIPLSQFHKRQGCPSIEPDDPNCLLPFWTNRNLNLTFDDLKANTAHPTYQSLHFTNFTVATPDLSATAYLTPNTPPNYLRLKASTPGFISTADSDLSFFKITGFAFGCSQKSGTPTKEKPQSCTLTVAAMCAGPHQSVVQVQEYTSRYGYVAPRNGSVAGLTYADMGTNGHMYECYNYTLTATAAGGKPAVLFVDQVSVIEYFASGLY